MTTSDASQMLPKEQQRKLDARNALVVSYILKKHFENDRNKTIDLLRRINQNPAWLDAFLRHKRVLCLSHLQISTFFGVSKNLEGQQYDKMREGLLNLTMKKIQEVSDSSIDVDFLIDIVAENNSTNKGLSALAEGKLIQALILQRKAATA